MICIKCDNEVFADKSNAIIEQEFRGERLQVKMTVSACTKCGWQTLSLGQTDELRRLTADAYREKHGLLTTALIKFIRKSKRQSQAEFAAFLGVGEASVQRWEAGLVQDKAYDQLIRMKCAKELSPIEMRRKWVAALAATGWVSVSLVRKEGTVANATQPSAEPQHSQFVAPKPPAQSDLWETREDADLSNSTAAHEEFALAA